MGRKVTPEGLLKQKLRTRNIPLVVLIFTVINLAKLLTGSDSFFLFSASIPYFLTAFGLSVDMRMGAEGIGTYTLIALVISAAVLLLYLVCWLQRKRHPRRMVVALVMFLLDTLVLVILCLSKGLLAERFADLVFHALVLLNFVRFVSADRQLTRLIEEFDPLTTDDDDDLLF